MSVKMMETKKKLRRDAVRDVLRAVDHWPSPNLIGAVSLVVVTSLLR